MKLSDSFAELAKHARERAVDCQRRGDVEGRYYALGQRDAYVTAALWARDLPEVTAALWARDLPEEDR